MKIVNRSFTYAEYALEKYLLGDHTFMEIYDFGVDDAHFCYRSIYNFPRIGKQAKAETYQADLEIQSRFHMGQSFSDMRIRMEIEQIGSS